MSKVGDSIRDARNAKGMSQKQLGKKLGVSEGFINEIESGKKVINEKFMERIGKVLGGSVQNMSSMFQNIAYEEEKSQPAPKAKAPEKVNDVWNDAFGSVIKTIGIYGYDLNKTVGTKQLPVISKKVEGFNPEKVLFIKIENDDLMGFRICKDDVAFANLTNEIENNAICLIDYNDTRVIRQIKRLDNNKLLLISNKNSLKTETVSHKDIKVIAKLNRVEFEI
ncbi:helix-turn-helix domain-containing protein [Clostridium senegalense]|uniref:helix-turn-helix domain-containing protein n=1 Tax=Clostridium senegalense TaxID=1465809 RepID=UPI000288CC39|nr:helix-turn-helix transcriptional regulator [Clostridium senegalense]